MLYLAMVPDVGHAPRLGWIGDAGPVDLDEVLKAFEYDGGKVPKKAVAAAMEAREAITPALLRMLADSIDRAEAIVADFPEKVYSGHDYALYLLAAFRETRAYPLVVRLARLESQLLDDLIGDVVTEDLSRILASVCGGDTQPLKDLIEDPAVDEYVRGAALEAFTVLVAMGDKPRAEVMDYFQTLFENRLEREHSHVWNALVYESKELHPAEVADQLQAAYQANLVDEVCYPLEEVERALAADKDAHLQKLQGTRVKYIDDVSEDMAKWEYNAYEGEAQLESMVSPLASRPVRSEPKIGPNEQCPCGSGKKYKKCCGRMA